MRQTIRRIEACDVATIASTLARAMWNDPFARYIEPNDELRERTLARIYRVYAETFMPHGGCFTTSERTGAALWLPPGRYPPLWREYLKMTPGIAGALGFRRLAPYLRAINLMGGNHPTGQQYWYLCLLGVEPKMQGQRLGTRLLEPVLELCNQNRTGAHLETANQRTLGLYERLGFKVAQQIELRGGPRLWGMWRSP